MVNHGRALAKIWSGVEETTLAFYFSSAAKDRQKTADA
jgi:hypothetical protein